jgi:LAO/AO transport system kinase
VVTCSALTRAGLDTLWEMVQTTPAMLDASGELQATAPGSGPALDVGADRRGPQERFHRHPEVQNALPRMMDDVRRGELSPTSAARSCFFCLTRIAGIRKECSSFGPQRFCDIGAIRSV